MNTPPYQTLVEMLRQRAEAQGDQRIYTYLRDGETDEKHINYAELDRQARLIAARLQQIGGVGERALLIYPPGLEYVAAFFGCLYAGWIAVPSYPPNATRQDPRLFAIIEDADAKVALTDDFVWQQLEPFLPAFPPLQAFEWVVTDTLSAELAPQWQMPSTGWDSNAFFQYTSGSTGKPKGVMLTHGNLLSNLALIKHAFALEPGERGCSWLPPYHDMGLIGGILQPIYCDGYTVLMSPLDFLKRPARWLENISRYQVTVAGGPNFAYDWCVDRVSEQDRAGLDLCSWTLTFNGAEPVRTETMRRFADTYRSHGFQHKAFYPCYGLAEGTLIISGGERDSEPVVTRISAEALENNIAQPATGKGSRELVSSGRALLDQTICIVQPDSRQPLADGAIGEIWAEGGSISKGYWKKPTVTAETLNATLADGTGSYLRTGDLGFMQDGELFVTGRLKDLIIIRGRNYYPQDIEFSIANCHEAIQPNAGAAFSVDIDNTEKLIIVQELRRTHSKADPAPIIAEIRATISEQHELVAHTIVLIKPRSISKTSSGKIQRRLIRNHYLKNKLRVIAKDTAAAPAPAAPDAPAVAAEPSFLRQSLLAVPDERTRQILVGFYLQEQLALRLNRPKSDITKDQSLTRFGLDSLLAIELKNEIDKMLMIDLPLELLFAGPSIIQLSAAIVDRLTAPNAPSKLIAAPNPPQQFPLSAGQRALWYLYQVAPDSAVYNVARAGRVAGGLDSAKVKAAVAQVVARHPILRTTFELRDGEPQQTVQAIMSPEIVVHSDSAELDTLANVPFDLAQGPLWRIHLVQEADATTVLLVLHHIITDFWSIVVLLEELLSAYAGETLPPAPRLHLSDYVAWQTKTVAQATEKWTYWQKQLADIPALALPSDRPRPPVQTYNGALHQHVLTADLTSRLNQLAQDHTATPFVLLLAAYQTLLQRFTGQADIVVGTPLAGRDDPKLATLLGYFANPIALRTHFDADQSFADLLAQVRQTVLDGMKNSLPLPLLVERFQQGRDLSRSPFFQTLFVVQKAFSAENPDFAAFAVGQQGNPPVQLSGLTVTPIPLNQNTAQFDLSLSMAEIGGQYQLRWEYNSDLFNADSISRMANAFATLLAALPQNSDAPLHNLPILDPASQQQLATWHDTTVTYPQAETPLHRLFEQQAARTPDRIALQFADKTLTYQQLDQQTNQLAHHLQALGVKPGTRVGVCLERSFEMLIALYAILKAGGAYVPLAPDYPTERLNFMLADADAPILLTHSSLLEKWDEDFREMGCIALDQFDFDQFSGEAVVSAVSVTDAAYLIYTSGSTGQPKGVLNAHRGIVNRLLWMQDTFDLQADDHILQKTPYSFDVSVWEFFWPLITGARLVIAKPNGHLDSGYLCDLIKTSAITTIHFVPSMLQIFLADPKLAQVTPFLKRIICSGEALPYDLVTRTFDRLPQTELYNLYGPTEAAVDVSCWHCQPNDAGIVPIGRAIANTQLHVLDKQLNPQPIGVVGELFIGGVQVAQGYLNRPELTAQRFIDNERFGRLYKTGDLVKQLPDGNLVFVGRSDFQVKLRGFRIELGEIESQLLAHTAIREALVTVVDDKLVAYFVADEGVDSAELRSHLNQALPAHMLPNIYMPLTRFPLNANGKIDRHQLPTPQASSQAAYVAPRSQLEQDISTIWANLLHVQKIGIHDNFFDLGGHSLLLVQAHRQLQAQLDQQIPLVKMLEKPTVASLTSYLSSGPGKQTFTTVNTRADKQRMARRRYR
ncbi:MAG TPA: amino acid adenylation domain-containing protein [Anaerolineae bacterium]|nr:amino acid adenylation domain-containing protein [Anaerolineae bacterium]